MVLISEKSGKAFSKAMKEAGYTKYRLAQESGLSYPTITRMCRGDLKGYMYSWVVACNVMGVSLYDVLQGEDLEIVESNLR